MRAAYQNILFTLITHLPDVSLVAEHVHVRHLKASVTADLLGLES